MIIRITVDLNYRAATIDYKDGMWLTITRADYDKYMAFVDNCMKFCKHVYISDNGWRKVFEF